MLYHIVEKAVWDSFDDKDYYFPANFKSEGFIHLSDQQQVAGVLERYYVGVVNLLLLHLDPALFMAKLKYEASSSSELFPHLYGHLNKSSVLKIEKIS